MVKRIYLLALTVTLAVMASDITTTMPPLTTKRPWLPRKQSGYAFVSNIEQLAYVSYNRTSMIHFMPVNPSRNPRLFIAVPNTIRIEGAFRDLTTKKNGTRTIEGTEYDLYAVVAGPRASKYTFFWRLLESRPDGTEMTGFYWGEWNGGVQEPQRLPIHVVEQPEITPFKEIPVYLSMPNDFFAQFPDIAGLRKAGFNFLDMWTYLTPDERGWGTGLLDQSLKAFAKAGVKPVGWIREWWWHNGMKEPDGQATKADGSKTDEMLCLSYRGKWYQLLLEQGRYLIDRGVTFHSTDPEMYGDGVSICFCNQCREGFRKWLQNEWPDVQYRNPMEMAANSEANKEYLRLWEAYKCKRYTDFFADYRREMESYIAKKGLAVPFTFMIYSSYHRSFPGFSAYADYRDSHSYRMTLEDPATFPGVFDIVAPMIYMDVYANYEPYDMLLPATDTATLLQIMRERAPVAPILCTGYPFVYAFGSDLNAEMLRCNMLEVIGAGGKGFGFWGECPFDAADMRAVAQVAGMLQPYERLILDGITSKRISAPSQNAIVKRIESPHGSLVLVSEYSRKPIEVTVDCPVDSPMTAVELSTGKSLATLTPRNTLFTIQLGESRAVMVAVIKK